MHQHDSVVDWWEVECYEEPRSPGKNGYVLLSHRSRLVYAHRLTWEECYGDILTRDDVIAHHCDNRRCRQPLHLFATDLNGNNQDMYEKGRGRGQFQTKDVCLRGHSLVDAMVGRSRGQTYQRCRTCQREWKKARRAHA